MGKLRSLIIAAAALSCPFLACSGNIGQAMQSAAYFTAGAFYPDEAQPASHIPNTPEAEAGTAENAAVNAETNEAPRTEPAADTNNIPETSTESETSAAPGAETSESAQAGQAEPSDNAAQAVQPITLNRSDYTEAATEYNGNSGAVLRRHYGASLANDHITLSSGAQVRNCTSLPNETLAAAADDIPVTDIDLSEPTVLIVHTHTTECFQSASSAYYDAACPTRTRDCSRNMVAVGDALVNSLAKNGITAVHDCTVHDYPAYSGAYDRSEDTIRAALEKYPSIRIVIDLHRDAIENADGTRIAPVADINGRSAAQFMIIAGCDDGRFNMPDYMENFRLACLIQNTAEEMYAGLARPVLFDYRNYNQHITTGSLLIEVGSHGNSLDEALYTGELLGDILALTAVRLAAE